MMKLYSVYKKRKELTLYNNDIVKVLTAQIEVAVVPVQVGDDGFDVVKGHSLESVIPKIEETNTGCTGKEVRFQHHQSIVAETQLTKVAHAVQRSLGYVLDFILIEFELSQLWHLHETALANHGDEVIA